LSKVRLAGLIGFGALFWVQAALTIRFFGQFDLFAPGWISLLWFALTYPMAIFVAEMSTQILKIEPKQFIRCVTIMCITALSLDAFALTWIPGLYGVDEAVRRGGAAWLLWGVACTLFYALLKKNPA
jgi:hypothetical protein